MFNTNNFRLLFLLCLFSVSILASQWKTGSSNNKFDGNYRYASIIGKGGEWPYTTPALNLNLFEDDEPNFYLSNIGYTGCSHPSLSFTFDSMDEVLVYSSTSNSDGDAAFVNATHDKLVELFELLKEKSVVYVRHESRCGKNDYQFSLRGSTVAINYVLGEYYDTLQALQQRERKLKKEQDSLKEISRLQELKDMRRIDSLEAVRNQIFYDDNSKEFRELLLKDFDFKGKDVNKTPVVLLLEFQVSSTVTATFCKKYFASGTVAKNNEQHFYKSNKLKLYNRIEDGCIRLDVYDEHDKFQNTIFLSNVELSKLSDDFRIKVINSSWMDILNLVEN